MTRAVSMHKRAGKALSLTRLATLICTAGEGTGLMRSSDGVAPLDHTGSLFLTLAAVMPVVAFPLSFGYGETIGNPIADSCMRGFKNSRFGWTGMAQAAELLPVSAGFFWHSEM